MYNIFVFMIVWLDIGFVVTTMSYILNHLNGSKKQKELFDLLTSDGPYVGLVWIGAIIGHLYSMIAWPTSVPVLVKKTRRLIEKKRS